MEKILQDVGAWVATYGLQVLGAVVILVVGWLAAKIVRRAVERLLEKAKVEETLARFVAGLVHIALLTFIIIAASRTVHDSGPKVSV